MRGDCDDLAVFCCTTCRLAFCDKCRVEHLGRKSTKEHIVELLN